VSFQFGAYHAGTKRLSLNAIFHAMAILSPSSSNECVAANAVVKIWWPRGAKVPEKGMEVKMTNETPDTLKKLRQILKKQGIANDDITKNSRNFWRKIAAKGFTRGRFKREPCVICNDFNSEVHHHNYRKKLHGSATCITDNCTHSNTISNETNNGRSNHKTPRTTKPRSREGAHSGQHIPWEASSRKMSSCFAPNANEQDLLALLKPCPDEALKVWPVDRMVGNVRNNRPQLIFPALGNVASA
jgi:hypothetical protein